MPERPQYLRDLDSARRADIQVGRSDAAYGKHTMSRPWQAYNQMQTMQNQANPDLDRLKAVRRDWNRNLKYTPAGMAVSGATTPMDAQNAFMRGTETFRQANPSAYRSMYPITGGIMHLGEKGGLLGTILSEIGKMGKKKEGIVTNVDDSAEEQEKYITETFGPHLEDVPYGGPPPYEYEGPWPHPEGEPSLMAPPLEEVKTREEKIQELADEKQRQIDNFETNASSDILDEAIESQWPTKDPVVFDDYVSDRLQRLRDSGGEPKDDISKYEDYIERGQEPLPFDEGREDFIRRQNEYVSPSPVFPGNVRQDPQDTDAYLRWKTAPPLGAADPQGDFDRFNEYPTPEIGVEFGGEEVPPALPPYEGREFGLGQFINEMPTSRKSDWEDYLEYVQRLGDMEGGRLEYDEWHDMMRRRR